MPKHTAVCKQCGIEKMREQFQRRVKPTGKPYRLRVCMTCNPEPKLYKTGHGPWKADIPCKQCGKEIWRSGPYCRVKMLKYCSDRCDRLARRKAIRKCTRCERKLPFEHFDRPPTASKHRKSCCRQCVAKASRDQEDGVQRTGPAAMLKISRTLARRQNIPHGIRIADTRRIYDGDCYLCGKAPYSLHLVHPSIGYMPENLWGLCLRCKTSVRHHGVGEVLTWSLEIAVRHFKDQLTLPERRAPEPCDHCGQLPKSEIEARRKQQRAQETVENGEPQEAERIVASLHEHVL